MGRRRAQAGAIVTSSLLVLVSVVVLPLLSFLVDLYLLDAARTRRRITHIAQPPADDSAQPQPDDPTTHPSVTAAQGDLSWRWPAPKEPPAVPPGSPPDAPLPLPARR